MIFIGFIGVAILGVFFGVTAGLSALFAIVTACFCWSEGMKSRGAFIASWFAAAPTVLSLAAVTLWWLRVRFASLDAVRVCAIVGVLVVGLTSGSALYAWMVLSVASVNSARVSPGHFACPSASFFSRGCVQQSVWNGSALFQDPYSGLASYTRANVTMQLDVAELERVEFGGFLPGLGIVAPVCWTTCNGSFDTIADDMRICERGCANRVAPLNLTIAMAQMDAGGNATVTYPSVERYDLGPRASTIFVPLALGLVQLISVAALAHLLRKNNKVVHV